MGFQGSFTLVGMVHLLPLPSGPGSSPGFEAVLERAEQDALTLVDGGIRSVLVENFGDAPFCSGRVPPHVVAMMAVIVRRIRRTVGDGVWIGVNVLRNDSRAAIAVAAAGNAQFIRVNVHTGSSWTDQGLLQGDAYQTLCYRSALGVEPREHSRTGVQLFADVFVKHGSPAGARALAEVARDTALRGRADGLIVTGDTTGARVDLDQLSAVVDAVPGVPVLAGSGGTPDTVAAIREQCAGAIVGTFLHEGGDLTAPVSRDRVRRLVLA